MLSKTEHLGHQISMISNFNSVADIMATKKTFNFDFHINIKLNAKGLTWAWSCPRTENKFHDKHVV